MMVVDYSPLPLLKLLLLSPCLLAFVILPAMAQRSLGSRATYSVSPCWVCRPPVSIKPGSNR